MAVGAANPTGKVGPAANYLLASRRCSRCRRSTRRRRRRSRATWPSRRRRCWARRRRRSRPARAVNPEAVDQEPRHHQAVQAACRVDAQGVLQDRGFHGGYRAVYIHPAVPRGCSSAWLECRTVTAEVAGSSPVSPAPSASSAATPSLRTGCFVSDSRRPTMTEPTSPRPRSGPARPGRSRPRPGARRAVDATLGDGGHAEALRARGRRGAGHRPRSRRDRREPRRGSATTGMRYLQARLQRARGARRRGRLPSRVHPARSRRLLPPAGRGGPRLYLPARALRSTCGWAAEARRPRPS